MGESVRAFPRDRRGAAVPLASSPGTHQRSHL